MSTTTLKATIASAVAAAATFTVTYATGQAQADFVDGQTVTVFAYERPFTCAVTFNAGDATVTWPAGAPYSLPVGEYYIDFDLVGGDEIINGVSSAANVAAATDSSGGTADGTIEAIGDTSTSNEGAKINNNFAELAAKQAAILSALKTAGLMVAD